MKPLLSPTTLLLPLLLAVVGCATPETRIERHGELFASFPAEVQEQVRQGIVRLGHTPDMVRLAVGPPRHTQRRIDANGTTTVWRYTVFRWRSASPPYWRRWHGPWSDAPPYHWNEREEHEVLRVEFRDDRVVAIEHIDR